MRREFIESIERHQNAFDVNLGAEQINALADYYEFVQEHNDILHLVAPSSAEEFAVRHVLESLTLLEFLSPKTKLADIGTGAGLPSIPCLLVRQDLRGVLIESKLKKVKFLTEAAEKLNLVNRVVIFDKQFEETEKPNASAVTCRALDKFTDKLPRILKWSGKSDLLLFGGDNLRKALRQNKLTFTEKLMPLSEQRYLFVVNRKINLGVKENFAADYAASFAVRL